MAEKKVFSFTDTVSGTDFELQLDSNSTREELRKAANDYLFSKGLRRPLEGDPGMSRGEILKNVIADSAVGALQTAGTIVEGAVKQPIVGLSGLFSGGMSKITGGDFLETAVNTMNQVSGNINFIPTNKMSEQQLQTMGTVLQPIAEGIESAGAFATDVSGSPLLGAGVVTLLEVGPAPFLGGRNPVSLRMQKNTANRQAADIARIAGIDPRLSPADQVAAVPVQAARMAADNRQTAQGFGQIAQAVRNIERNSRQAVSQMYEAAKASGKAEFDLNVPEVANELNALNQSLAHSAAEFNLNDLPQIKRVLNDFSRLITPDKNKIDSIEIPRRLSSFQRQNNTSRGQAILERLDARNNLQRARDNQQVRRSVVELNDIANTRKSLTKLTKSTDKPTSGAATALKAQIDEWLDAQFNTDMVSGSPEAIMKWENANLAFREYASLFRDNRDGAGRAIVNLTKMDATPEQIRQWIYGNNAVGAGSNAANVVDRLKSILGEKSQAFETLKRGAIYDIVEPLLRQTVDSGAIRDFQKNYNKFNKMQPSLKESLLGDSIEEIRSLSRILQAGDFSIGKPQLIKDVDRTLARVLYPGANALATGSAKLSIYEGIIKRARGFVFGEPNAREVYLNRLVGVDVGRPLINAQDATIAATIQGALEATNQFDEAEQILLSQ